MEQIKGVENEVDAERVINFLTSREAFELEMNDFRKKARIEAVQRSLSEKNCQYWNPEREQSSVTCFFERAN